jgi:hypothetical protein
VLMRLGGVARGAVPEVGVPDQVEALKQIEGAIDGGDVHRGRDALDLLADPLGGGVLQFPHRVEHELTLRSHPQAAVVQRTAQAGVHNNDGSAAYRPQPDTAALTLPNPP